MKPWKMRGATSTFVETARAKARVTLATALNWLYRRLVLQNAFSPFFQLPTLFTENKKPRLKILNDIPLSFAFIYLPTKNRDSSTPFVASVWAELFLGAISTSSDYSIDNHCFGKNSVRKKV